ncbi:MAG: hypothetical protein A4E72_01684 [Syntrophus sp. PtaU1.Bin208]|nr:MAG: hypothetical protein A4E72_01684 [Syntrophus sp. PtaU1.Bin208]
MFLILLDQNLLFLSQKGKEKITLLRNYDEPTSSLRKRATSMAVNGSKSFTARVER